MGASKEVGYEARRLGVTSALLVQRGFAIIALHVWICAVLKQKLYNIEMTPQMPQRVTAFCQNRLLFLDPSRNLTPIVLPHQDHRFQRPRITFLLRNQWAPFTSSTLLLICVFV
jgi:hypothetical protein